MTRFLLCTVVVLLSGAAAGHAAELGLPWILSNHAVLQRDVPVPIWGFAAAGTQVRVEFAGQTRSAVADTEGRWKVTLDPMAASAKGRVLSVRSGETVLSLPDVLVGEVWLCSGQSNMDKPLGPRANQKPTVNHEQEIAAANFPQIRLMVARRGRNPQPGQQSSWQACSPQSVKALGFSAVGYFFARRIHQELGVPVGMIQSSVGGTGIEAWTAPEAFAAEPSLREFADAARRDPPTRVRGGAPSSLYRTMIAPLVPYAIRGALWYQGEANVWTDDGPAYTDKMRALVGGWREAWGQGDFPFYYVQLAPHRYSARPNRDCPPHALPLLRDAQARALEIPNTAMVVTTDLVDDVDDIHPVRKREVGERLALCALARDYGKTGIEYRGPVCRQVNINGAAATVMFENATEGLKSRDGQPLSDFTIAGADGKFIPAAARIEGKNVIVSSPDVPQPKFVRFGWDETATPNLANGVGLPAVPFRSDDLPR